MAAQPLCCPWSYHVDYSDLLAVPKLFRSDWVRVEFRQGRRLVGNLASLLDDPVELAEVAPAIEDWAKQQEDRPSRSRAIRRLIEIALTAKSKRQSSRGKK
ncbi:MAG TPA: hypothetical protein VK653_19865 [Xanthobacteraceae bacterium]|nr:hypothetical protein [Xanthobacteraceae bacterium]